MLNISIDYLLPAEKRIQASLVPKRNLFFFFFKLKLLPNITE